MSTRVVDKNLDLRKRYHFRLKKRRRIMTLNSGVLTTKKTRSRAVRFKVSTKLRRRVKITDTKYYQVTLKSELQSTRIAKEEEDLFAKKRLLHEINCYRSDLRDLKSSPKSINPQKYLSVNPI